MGDLRCAWCGKVILRDVIADPRGTDGICPQCSTALMQKAGWYDALRETVVRLLRAVDAANKPDFHDMLSVLREEVGMHGNQSAADEGYRAAVDGVGRDKNPYEAGDPRRPWWEIGWLEYEEEEEEEK